MQTNQFRSLKEAALSVTQNKQVSKLNESVEPQVEVNPELTEFVNFVSDLVEMTEESLETKLSSEEISEVTTFVLGKIGFESLMEQIEAEVGFELNENEIQYVLETLNEGL